MEDKLIGIICDVCFPKMPLFIRNLAFKKDEQLSKIIPMIMNLDAKFKAIDENEKFQYEDHPCYEDMNNLEEEIDKYILDALSNTFGIELPEITEYSFAGNCYMNMLEKIDVLFNVSIFKLFNVLK